MNVRFLKALPDEKTRFKNEIWEITILTKLKSLFFHGKVCIELHNTSDYYHGYCKMEKNTICMIMLKNTIKCL